MNPTIERVKLLFVGLFAVIVVGILVWQVGWIWPEQRCEKAHKWWDSGQRVCATPVLISDITGRPITDARAKVAAMQAIGRPIPANLAAQAAAEQRAAAAAKAQ
jgi:hypothetical protein